MSDHVFPSHVIQRVLKYLNPQDIAFRTCLLDQTWHRASLVHLYRRIPPFSSAFQLLRVCRTVIAHPEHVARSVLEISIVHCMQDMDKIPTLNYTVRAALALCTRLEALYLHTEPSVMRTILGECTFQLRTLSVIDCHQDLPTVFLSRQQNLEELTILRGDTTPLYLPKGALPNLSSFSGIQENAIRISRGRQLKTLRIIPGPTSLNLSNTLFRLDSLVMSSLKEFHVIVTGSVLYHITILTQFLPRLTTVVIRYYQRSVPFGDFAKAISAFVDLREYTMLSLDVQPPLTPVALLGEHSIVMRYHTQCPTLRVVALRSVCWVYGEGGNHDAWYPHLGDPGVHAMWQNSCEKTPMDMKEAEDILHSFDKDMDQYSSGDYVDMDIDGASENGIEISHGEPTVGRVVVYADEVQDTKHLVAVEKGGKLVQNLEPHINGD